MRCPLLLVESMSQNLPHFTALPYQPGAITALFAPLSTAPWSALLHSGHACHQDSRFDIMVADPRVTLTTRGNVTELCRDGQTSLHAGDPFELLRQQLELSGITPAPHGVLPFLGGALGLFGYDLARRLETLPWVASADVSLPDMAVGIYHWALIADNQLQELTLVSYGDPAPLLRRLTAAPISQPIGPFRLTCDWRSNMSRSEYGRKFRRIQQHLDAGDCYQVCLAQRFSAAYQGSEWQAFLHLLAHNKAPFSAFIRIGNEAVISLSPERFLSIKTGQIETRPIKGTLPRLADPLADERQKATLAQSAKDRAENLMIVDLLRNDIGRIAVPGSVRVPALFAIESFTAVHHMVSTITATLPADRHPCELLRACFPGGSITGAPKVSAMKVIEQLEPSRRNAWCGSMGYISFCGALDCNIAIRTLLTDRGTIHCWAGGGIVADSTEQAEYQETLAKVASILPLLTQLNGQP